MDQFILISLSLSLYIYIYIYIYVCCIFSFKHVWLDKTDILCVSILSLISSSLFKNRLTFGWNQLRKALYISQAHSASTEVIFGEGNNEKTNIMLSYIKSRKNEWKENLQKKRILREVRERIGWKFAFGILECGCYIRIWSYLTKVC